MATETLEERVQKLESTLRKVQEQLAEQVQKVPGLRSAVGGGLSEFTPNRRILMRWSVSVGNGAVQTVPKKMRRTNSV